MISIVIWVDKTLTHVHLSEVLKNKKLHSNRKFLKYKSLFYVILFVNGGIGHAGRCFVQADMYFPHTVAVKNTLIYNLKKKYYF